MRSGVSRAQSNKAIRQEALRQQLSNGKHVEHIIDMANKLADLEGTEMDSIDVQRLNAAISAKRALINKYLPDLKATEYTIDHTGTNTADDHAQAIGEVIGITTGRAKVPPRIAG